MRDSLPVSPSGGPRIPGGATQGIATLGGCLLAVALLMPVGDAPWHSFWREWMAAIAVLLMAMAALSTLRELNLPLRLRVVSLPAAAIALAAQCLAQRLGGQLHNLTDALLPAIYLLAFALCMMIAESLPRNDRDVLADRLAAAWVVAALLSAPLAVLQWTGTLRLDLGMRVDYGRPVAHMEQANLLGSLMIQGMVGLWRLCARGRLNVRLGTLLAAPMLISIVLTQSRTAWLVAACGLAVLVWRRDLVRWRPHGQWGTAACVALAIGSVALPAIDAMMAQPGLTLAQRSAAGTRPDAWLLFLDAVVTRPWLGWGVLQNGEAQYALALGHVSLLESFSSAHDIVIDLMVWFGAPVGVAAGLGLGWAVWRRVRRSEDVAALSTACAAAALWLHAMVEFPLHYLFFLLPFGLILGLTAPSGDADRRAWRISLRGPLRLPALSLAPAFLLALLAHEYLRVTDVRPVLAYEMTTRHVGWEAALPAPELFVLDRLADFHRFAALPQKAGLGRADLDAAHAAMLRQPFVPSIERFAVLDGLNGRPLEAQDALRRISMFCVPEVTAESQRAWKLWRARWPVLPPWPPEQPR